MLQTRPRLYLVILKVRAAKRYRYLTTALFSRFPWKNHQPTKPQELFAVVEMFVKFTKYASKNQTFGYTTQPKFGAEVPCWWKWYPKDWDGY